MDDVIHLDEYSWKMALRIATEVPNSLLVMTTRPYLAYRYQYPTPPE